jgi:tetratricopeptide (TPR) repeat protein
VTPHAAVRAVQSPSALAIAAVISVLVWAGAGAAPASDATRDQAYAYNRDGLTAMSKARYEEAIQLFDEAARMVPDYGILNRSLSYTPTFMLAWAAQKLGRNKVACRHFQDFLDIAPAELLEPDKATHAREFLATQCGATGTSVSHPRTATSGVA